MKLLLIAALLYGTTADARSVYRGPPTVTSARVIGGADADIADFPHQVSLMFSGSHTCGASIISGTKILTAAHCTAGRSATGFSIRAGSTDRESGGQTRDVSSKSEHDDYIDSGSFPNDVAVVTLSSALSIGGNVQPADLAQGSNDYAGDTCDISGWGRDDQGSNTLPTILQRRQMVVLSNAQCSQETTGITGGHVCIESSDGQGSACNGDSGGPLTCGSTQVGIASWVFGNCITTMLNGYTRVSFFYTWINGQM